MPSSSMGQEACPRDQRDWNSCRTRGSGAFSSRDFAAGAVVENLKPTCQTRHVSTLCPNARVVLIWSSCHANVASALSCGVGWYPR